MLKSTLATSVVLIDFKGTASGHHVAALTSVNMNLFLLSDIIIGLTISIATLSKGLSIISAIWIGRVIVTAVLADRYPADLVLFRNYEPTLQRPMSCPPKKKNEEQSQKSPS
ncbi:hypothetical protein PoB_006591500 [Plakobranchus ocellatus]|uniref:Uncharacterized protein n=1 Tax=Plakobranchus ocellatus TaxID=259542 RepID=A0AAV4D5P3_9GAST|nr:hypothetical protein PoB_006591500 [Plakobranchus ocellatus]